MTTPQRFSDVEEAMLRWVAVEFADRVPAGNYATETPLTLQDRIADVTKGFVRVERIGGRDDDHTDRAVVDVEVFAKTRRMAYTLAEDIRARLLTSPHRVNAVDKVIILDRVNTERAPTRLPAEDENITRFTATYTVSARR